MQIALPHRACIQVSIKRLASLYDDDELRVDPPVTAAGQIKLRSVVAWVRLVIWENLENGCRSSHVNIASYLRCLLKANLQPFGHGGRTEFSAYMLDYNDHRMAFRLGDHPLPDDVDVPDELSGLGP